MYRLNEFFNQTVFRSLLVPLLLIILGIFAIHSIQIMTIIESQKKELIERFHQEAQVRVHGQADEIEMILGNIETQLLSIQNVIEDYYKNQIDFIVNKRDRFEIRQDDQGFYYKPESHIGSGVVFMPQASPTKQDITDAYNLERLDHLSIPLVDRNDHVVAAWMNLENYMVRYYPFFDMRHILEPDMDLKSFNFYYEADPVHNPQMQNIWTTPYLDPAMKGWMTSRVAPIRKEHTFLGVFGIDVNIQDILMTLPQTDEDIYQTEIFITNSQGDLYAISERLKQFFDLNRLKEYTDGKSLATEIVQPEQLTILNPDNNALTTQIRPLFKKSSYVKVDYKESHYYIYSAPIKNIGWKIFNVVEERQLLSRLNTIEKENLRISITASFAFITLFLIIILNLRHKVKKSAVLISRPIEELSKATKDLRGFRRKEDEQILEISELYDDFYEMSREVVQNDDILNQRVDERTEELNEKIKTIEELQVKLIDQSIRDPLTDLFNRRYGNDVLSRESSQAILEEEPLAIAMIDIDHFKDVNDNYGHQEGDTVLIKLSSIIRAFIKHRDVAVRYGGEEFLLILPRYSKVEASALVSKIRYRYHELMIESNYLEHGLTLSAGIASFPEDSNSVEVVIDLADKALYDSKKGGRDTITIYSAK